MGQVGHSRRYLAIRTNFTGLVISDTQVAEQEDHKQ